ncbi:MAG: NUDIX hydrolase [Clostridiales bacterium]|nr:NUDIX hydrolase [Clostridiales bacterium]
MKALYEAIQAYRPYNEQEEKDRERLLSLLESGADLWTRDNETAHLTASAWVVSPSRDKVLMVYHNIYQSWSWLGGHADGDRDLARVAVREVQEESGLTHVRLVSPEIFSLEILTVDGHEKRGRYVSSHLHLNVTFLIEADPEEPLTHRPDENAAVAWFTPEEAVERSTEPWFRTRIYNKLNAKLVNTQTGK